MKMEGRDSAEFQNWEKKDINVILKLFKLENDKRGIVSSSSKSKKGEKRVRGVVLHRKLGSHFRERVFSFSLGF